VATAKNNNPTFNGWRHFRIRQTGKNSSYTDELCCGGIELYGKLTINPDLIDEEKKYFNEAKAKWVEDDMAAYTCRDSGSDSGSDSDINI
jgi:hypothetical protein